MKAFLFCLTLTFLSTAPTKACSCECDGDCSFHVISNNATFSSLVCSGMSLVDFATLFPSIYFSIAQQEECIGWANLLIIRPRITPTLALLDQCWRMFRNTKWYDLFFEHSLVVVFQSDAEDPESASICICSVRTLSADQNLKESGIGI